MERKFTPNEGLKIFPFKFDYDDSVKMAYIDYGDNGQRVTNFSEEEELGRLVDYVGEKIVGVEFMDTTFGLNLQGIPYEKEIREFCEVNGVLVKKEI